MRLLIMDGNTVANVIEVDPTAIPPEFADAPVAPDDVGVGMMQDGSEWVVDPDYAAAELAAKRAAAEIDRVPFLLAMVSLGVIDNDTALEASDGTWPAAFDPFLVPLSLQEKMTVKSAWRAADRVRLDSPVLATIAAYTQTEEAMVTVTQSDLDTVFGVSA